MIFQRAYPRRGGRHPAGCMIMDPSVTSRITRCVSIPPKQEMMGRGGII